ncbi:hypothetical protein WNY97_19220 [Pseudoalteromonas fuliginea]|uniref:hypothetical protein n=1 Tax=Pseudoalteromonas fuliginea TaxID=1872678 RepID=UPI003172BA48
MIKWILLILTTVFTTKLYADEAYFQTRCDSIKKERETIQSKFRHGYSIKEGEYLTSRDKFLFTQLANHCSKPKKSGSAYQATSSTSTRTPNSNWLLNQKVSNMSLHSDSYKDAAKLDAWSTFYKLPKRCRKKGIGSADFVWCSEYRGKQKDLFEAQWKEHP